MTSKKTWNFSVEYLWPVRSSVAFGFYVDWVFDCPTITVALFFISFSASYSYGVILPPKPVTFEEAWAEYEKIGYQYSSDALEQVRFGWNMGKTFK